MNEIDDIIKHFLDTENERTDGANEQESEGPSPRTTMNATVKDKLEALEDYIAKRCKPPEVSIALENDGFIVSRKYRLKQDFGTVYDKNHEPVKIGDKVRLRVYYGETEGEVVDLNRVDSIVYVNIQGDVFFKESSKCELVHDKAVEGEKENADDGSRTDAR